MNERERIQALEARVLALEAQLAAMPVYAIGKNPDETLYAQWPNKIPQDHPWWQVGRPDALPRAPQSPPVTVYLGAGNPPGGGGMGA